MSKYTLQMNDKLDGLLEDLAQKEGIPKSQVIRRALMLLKLAEDKQDEGYGMAFTKDDEVAQKILLT